jgi:hypothetical protein
MIPFKYLVFRFEFSYELYEVDLTWEFALNLKHVGSIYLNQNLGNWRIWDKKVWATIYLILNDTWIPDIILWKSENWYDEILHDKVWIPTRAKNEYILD